MFTDRRSGRTDTTTDSDTFLIPTIRGGGHTDIGHLRTRNEDAILVEPALGLYAVFDGVGGRNAGDLAARMASDILAAYVRTRDELRQRSPRLVLERALCAASEVVYFAGRESDARRGMKTTAVACLVDPARVVIAHVGDSRAYLLRDGKLTALTRDHTVGQHLVDEGKLKPGSLPYSPTRHMITRCLGHRTVEPEVMEQALRPGDRLLLCSDGLHGFTRARTIRRVLAGKGTPEQIAHELVRVALQRPAPDNLSAVVITVDGGRARTTTPTRRS